MTDPQRPLGTLPQHRTSVRPEWTDYNGHMNVAYYVLIFDQATDLFLAQIGMDQGLREATGSSVFVAEAHVTYDAELLAGEDVRVETQLLGFDEKRLHLFHTMFRVDDGRRAAGNELMILQVNLNDRRVGPFPQAVRARIAEIWQMHCTLDRPDGAGRTIALKPRR